VFCGVEPFIPYLLVCIALGFNDDNSHTNGGLGQVGCLKMPKLMSKPPGLSPRA